MLASNEIISHRVRFIFSLILLLWFIPAHAIVNIESSRIQPADGWSGNMSFGVNGSRGNNEKSNVSLDSSINYRKQTRTLMLLAARDYGKSNDITNNDSKFVHLRYINTKFESVALEVFTQFQSDEFKRLSDRKLLGVGARWKWVSKKAAAHILGLGSFRSNEKYNASVVNSERQELAWRANLYWVYKMQFNSQVSLSQTLYVQPDVDDFSDLRLLDQVSLTVKVSDKVALKLKLDISHDSLPPQLTSVNEQLEETDTKYFTAIEYSF